MARRVTLEDLTFTFRCQESWADMDGGDAVRHCGSCDKDVVDLSALPRAQAEDLLRETRGKICVRLFRTPDGRVVSADDVPLAKPVATCGSFTPSRLSPRRRALWRRLSTGAAAAAVVLQPGACEESPLGGDITEPGPGLIDPAQGEILMGEPMWEPPPQDVRPMMGRLAIEPFEQPQVEPEQPAELTPVVLEELLGGIGYIE